eukprot:Seg1437.4 transcript_id=Seg1437.4/GoldUCD/mRNA.D3Y31 product="ATP-dependent helicase SGS1" protein_id=Seg1437.4/GoldUCD/D3Y31
MLVDSHCVPQFVGGNDSGVIVLLRYTECAKSAVNKVVEWVFARLPAGGLPNYHQSLIRLVVENNAEQIEEDLETSINWKEQWEEDLSYMIEETRESTCGDADVIFIDDDSLDETLLNIATDASKEAPESFSKAWYVTSEDIAEASQERQYIWKGALTTFGFSKFKPFQLAAINAIENRRDVVIIQPTNARKSICFQVPAIIAEGKMTFVISPTIALIQSQVCELKQRGIDAVTLGRCAGTDEEANTMRIFSGDKETLPRLVYTTPEYFEKNIGCLQANSENIKMFVFDEVHKVFDRSGDFRAAYDAIKSIRSTFPENHVVALTATLHPNRLFTLCNEYLNRPVVIKGSIDRQNTRIEIAKYKCDSTKSVKSKGNIWLTVAKDVATWIGGLYSIVYMDFTNEVKAMSQALSRDLRIDCRQYHGKGMSQEARKKTMEEFCNKQFQVLCATECYEVGVHNPHVDLVARIGCMRNMNVLWQEFGRAGREEGSTSVGFLLINEHRDDQRLAYWIRNCSMEEESRIKAEYRECWCWIYCAYTGDCLRESLLQHYSEEVTVSKPDPGDCCLCCRLDLKKDFDVKEALDGRNLELILVDFDDAQANGLKEALGAEKCGNVLRGCHVHWTRSLDRVSKLATRSQEERDLFINIGRMIPNVRSKDTVIQLFDVLGGKSPVSTVPDLESVANPSISTKHWSQLRCWVKWWCRPNHLQMFTRAYSLLSDDLWKSGPRTTNPVESMNRESIHQKGCSLRALLENIYSEDRTYAARLAASAQNVTTSYNVTKRTSNRRRSSHGKEKEDNAPPDKRRHIDSSPKQKR